MRSGDPRGAAQRDCRRAPLRGLPVRTRSRGGEVQRLQPPRQQGQSVAMKRVVLALLAWLALALPAAAAAPRAGVPVGGVLPDANLAGLNGPARALAAFRGRPLIINVWASWCGPCRQEMESLERLAWRDRNQYFAIIGISTDDYPAPARALLEVTHATLSQFIDTGLQMETMLGATRLPLTVLVGPDGRVLQRIYGAREWDSEDSRQLIDAAFGRAH